MKALVLNGSPHRDKGPTGRLAGALVSGMVDAGATVETVNVYDLHAGGCLGCFTCWTRTPGVCAVRDDMDDVIAKVRDADVLVLATPVYCDGMTGVLKTVIDRIIPVVHGAAELRDGRMRHIKRAETKVQTVALVSVCGFVEPETFGPLIQHVQAIARNLNCAYAGALTVPGGLKPGRMETIAHAAHDAGIELVRFGVISGRSQEAMFGHSVTQAEAVATLNSYFDQLPGAQAGERH